MQALQARDGGRDRHHITPCQGERDEVIADHVDLGTSQVSIRAEEHFSQVVAFDVVRIDEGQMTHSCTHQMQRQGTPRTSHADDGVA